MWHILPQCGKLPAGIDAPQQDRNGDLVSDVRIIKRYGSRKLYDAEESRYVSLGEIGGWIRGGQEVRVLDNETSEDVTVRTLTQILSEDGKRGRVPSALLHDIIRFGGKAVSSGMDHLRTGVDRILRASLERLGPVSSLQEETTKLRERLDELEASLAALETGAGRPASGNGAKRKRPASAKAAPAEGADTAETNHEAARMDGAPGDVRAEQEER